MSKRPRQTLPTHKAGPIGAAANVPDFIAEAPWYTIDENDQTGDPLAHQRNKNEQIEPEWYDRGDEDAKKRHKKRHKATKFRKGACENCGAMTHKARDCLERPRKRGARFTNQDIKPDDEYKQIRTTYDSKRDRYNGYDPNDYREVIENFKKQKSNGRSDDDEDDEEDDDRDNNEDEDKERLLPASEKSRSMRSMEDKAAYLSDLHSQKELYNPRTRTMRAEDGVYDERGRYVEKLTGKAHDYQDLRLLAEKMDVNLEANPTAGLLKLKQSREEETEARESYKKSLLDYYGAEDPGESQVKFDIPTVRDGKSQTPVGHRDGSSGGQNQNVERDGTVGEALSGGLARSRYEEDVYPGNHTSIWGSYWEDGKWGYQCCHSTLKQSYCMRDD